MLTTASLLVAQLQFDPFGAGKDITPGAGLAEKLVQGVGFIAILLAFAGLLISAGVWAIGAYSQNYQQTFNGKRGVLVSVGAAIIIGASKLLIETFFGLGASEFNR